MPLSPEKHEIDDYAYFNPANVSYSDRFIEPILIDSMKKGYRSVLINNLDYQVGHKVLKFPRIIVNLLREIRRCIN